MGKRLNRPEDRLTARYLGSRMKRFARGKDEPAASEEARDVDLPYACPTCGDRSVAETSCDRCGVSMLRAPNDTPDP